LRIFFIFIKLIVTSEKMSWVIRCPTHGKVVTEYRSEGMTQLEKHGKEEQYPAESCYLYEDPEV
jgi:hypothetical protein